MKKKNNKGFTLIEIIVSLMIIGLLAVIFLPVFTMTVKSIFNAGRKNDATFQSQNEAEEKIGENVVTVNTQLDIVFDNITLVIDGEDVTNGELEYFLPD